MSTILIVLIIFPALWAGKPTNLTVLEDGIEIPGGIDVDSLDGAGIINAINDCKKLSGREIYSQKVKTKGGGSSKEIDHKTKIRVPLFAEIHLYTKFPVMAYVNDKKSDQYVALTNVSLKSKSASGAEIWESVWASLYYYGVVKIRMHDGKEVKDTSEVQYNTEGVQEIYVDVDEHAKATVPCFIEQSDGKYVRGKDFTFVMSKRRNGTYMWGQIAKNVLPKDQIIVSVRENSKDNLGKNDVTIADEARTTRLRSIYVQTIGAGKPKNLKVLEDGIEIPEGINVDNLDVATIINAINNCKKLSGRKIYSRKIKTRPGGKSKEIDDETKITFSCIAEIHLYTEFPINVWMKDTKSQYPIWIKSNKKITGSEIWNAIWPDLYYYGVTKISLENENGKEVKDDSEVFNLDGIQDIYVDADVTAEATIPCFIEQSDGKYVRGKDFTFVMSKRDDGTYMWGQIAKNVLPKDQIIVSVRENSKNDNGKREVVVRNGNSILGSVYLGSQAFVQHIRIKVLQHFPKVDKVYWIGSEITDQHNGIVELSPYGETVKVTMKQMFKT
ncbi:hypothetical protein DdX_16637 [Ditylenchus destructor]|uniref:Uncharacterized protein n=1 Tax=Ditylenchus destructor TaxID=166010 RepID=A0AAD4MP97_9BILA|nr:hypothetical protein DdX_16637 [Ditylenchus destructor]